MFLVNNTQFYPNLDFGDTLKIKSSNKDYVVNYTKQNLNELVRELYEKDDYIFIDRNVYNLSPFLENNMSLSQASDYSGSTSGLHPYRTHLTIFDATEDNKNITSVLSLIDILLSKNFTKKNKLLVIGGGITQEIGGFAAAIYKRGIPWILIPTTILSMTDSCIGSKVSINHGSKNMLGLFVAPDKIYISDYFLNSLSKDDIISGVGESLKLSLIGGMKTFTYFKEQYKQKNYMNIIKIASLVKKVIIEHDEFEKDERKVLNCGHTMGHAIESTTNYSIPHGIGVLIGMYIKNKLFYEQKEEYKEINDLILEMVNPEFFKASFNYEEFIKHVLLDKKNKGTKICFILLDEIGKSIFLYKERSEVEENLKKILKDLFINFK
jgi:3-dehydroquinate synthase